ncbi:hypothetical protein PF005_g21403 [Phytophthora fragariae]|uniref:HECT domain-containing protein n=3 Tax=Phytophthora TaxID=4783 RepID=A0A6A3QXH7_9STRA|nr:hypothetical protein PF007_g21369 [Phytophthora fragariae]KAE9185072.1 hypothetical protein PF005_g21403 [Phytophthora fragariae]KAE9196898.1 hypothetical protein PF004_g19998 [Phytophthora fragariae]
MAVAMPLLPRLLLFCDFLECRLHTSGVLLLRRILADFFAGNEHTLLDFMRLGASVVAVMPVERKSARRQQEAARLLALQKQTAAENVLRETPNQVDTTQRSQMDPPPPQICVFRYLSARVATKNIVWLRDMFQEFCRGEDALLREFVRRGNEPISVVPVDIQELSRAPLPPPPLQVETTANAAVMQTMARPQTETPRNATPLDASSTTPSTQRKRSRGLEQNTAGGRVVDGTVESRTRKQTRTGSDPAPDKENEVVAATDPEVGQSMLPSDNDIRTAIMSALERVEKQEPWKQILNFADMPMPFDAAEKHPKLVAALQEFWETNSQAVWERQFWAPLSRERYHEQHTLRRGRQSRAQNGFEKNVIPLVYKAFGAAFFVELDKRREQHYSWYYLDQVVDLFTLAQRCGLQTCLQYIESEAFKRFPVAPGISRNFFLRANGKSRSMWSSSPALKRMLDEIVALKAKTKGANRPVAV